MPVSGTQTRSLDIDNSRCVECGACVAVCSFDSIFLHSWGIEILQEICTLCGLCVQVCPTRALISNED